MVLTDTSLGTKARLVFPRLLSYHSQITGQCNPSEERLATDLGYTDRTIRSAVNELRVAGYIGKISGGGRHTPNQYNPVLIGGKNEYLNAEKKRFQTRKAASEEKKKEKKKELRPEPRGLAVQPARCRLGQMDFSQAEKKLESAFLARFPNPEQGYTALMSLPS